MPARNLYVQIINVVEVRKNAQKNLQHEAYFGHRRACKEEACSPCKAICASHMLPDNPQWRRIFCGQTLRVQPHSPPPGCLHAALTLGALSTPRNRLVSQFLVLVVAKEIEIQIHISVCWQTSYNCSLPLNFAFL